MGKAHATVIPQTNTTTPTKGFPNFGCFRRRSVGFARESCCIEAIIDLECQMQRGRLKSLRWGFRRPLSATATLFLPPSGGGRLGWGWFADIQHKGQEPSSPQPSPAERERGGFSWAKPTLRLLSLKSTQKIPLWVFSNFRHCPTV